MTTTANLAIELIDVNQSQKEVVANEAFSDIDAAICDSVDVEVTDGTNSITAATIRGAQRMNLVDGSTTAAFGIVLAAVKRLLIVTNSTAYDATVSCSGAGEAVVTAGASRALYCDGVDVFGLTAQAIGGAFIDLSDAPSSFSGAARRFVRVNSAASGVEFSAGELVINAQTGTSYTLALADAGALVTLDNVSSITATVPANSDVAFPVGTQVLLAQIDAGQVTVSPAAGVTIVTSETPKLRKAGAGASLVKLATNTWWLEGNLEAA